ncbi:MAG: aminomethyltransferase family protein [Actinomycetota bacterium]
MSVGTAFFPREAGLNSKQAWGEWAGYYAAAVYADFHDIEYNAIREAAAAIDVSPLYKYEVTGPDAGKLLDRIVTRDISKMALHQVYYTPWCDERGKVIDDGTVTRVGDYEYRVTSADPNYRWFNLSGSGLDYSIEDVSETLSGLALQGPMSREILERATGNSWKDLRYFRERPAEIGDIQVDVTRTGYTGDLGYELWVASDQAVALWDSLFDTGAAFGLRPAGIRALDVSRVEAGLILIEVEYTSAKHALTEEQQYSPYEIGLGPFVDLKKRDFTGRRALATEQRNGGPRRRLAGIEISWAGIEGLFAKHDLPPEVSPMVSREPTPLYVTGTQVGRATSTTWSPNLKKMVAIASVDAGYESPGTPLELEWTVEGERGRVEATVVPLPFLDLARKRA